MNRDGYQAVNSALYEQAESMYGKRLASEHYGDVKVVPVRLTTRGTSEANITNLGRDFNVKYVRFMLKDPCSPEFVYEALTKHDLLDIPGVEARPDKPFLLWLGASPSMVETVDLAYRRR